MRTTVSLDDQLLRRAKERAASQGRTLSEVVADALRVHLAEKPESRRQVILPTFGGSGLRPGVDLDDMAALVALLDEGSHAAR